MKLNRLVLFLFAALLFQSCKKDLVDPYVGENESEVVTANAILVQTVDQNGNAISGVEVKLGDSYKTSDANGVVQFSDIMVPSLNATIVSKKAGYFTSNYTINSSESEQTSVVVTLATSITKTISGSDGGRVDSEGGAFIEFPADGFLSLDGSVYSGNVVVSSNFINPDLADENNIMPNNFAGIDEKGEEVFVENHGMIQVELTDESGNELIVNPKNKAELHMPVLTSDMTSAPNKIPLYYFHEGLGKWVEDGEAKKKDDYYVGDVEHFTFWMCPYVYEHHQLSGKFECSGTPYSGATVNVYNQWGHFLGSTNTNIVGGFSGSIPESLTFTLEVEDPCGGVAYSETIGPFSSNTNLGVMELCTGTSVNYGVVEGTITDCGGSPDTDAYLSVQFDGKVKYLPANTLGAFNQAIIFCDGTTEVDFIAVSGTSVMSSANVTMATSNSMNFGNLQICDTPDEYCSYTFNGDQYFFTPSANKFFYCSLDFTNNAQSHVSVYDTADSQYSNQTSHFKFSNFDPSIGTHTIQGMSSELVGFTFETRNGLQGDSVDINLTYVGTSVGDYIEGNLSQAHTYVDGWGVTSTISAASFRMKINVYNP